MFSGEDTAWFRSLDWGIYLFWTGGLPALQDMERMIYCFCFLEVNHKKHSAFSNYMPFSGCFFPFRSVLFDSGFKKRYDKAIR